MKHAKDKTDYVLIFDADDRFEGKLELPELTADRYRLRMRNAMGGVVYYRPLLLRNDGTFYWRGVLHEFIETDKQDTWRLYGSQRPFRCTQQYGEQIPA